MYQVIVYGSPQLSRIVNSWDEAIQIATMHYNKKVFIVKH